MKRITSVVLILLAFAALAYGGLLQERQAAVVAARSVPVASSYTDVLFHWGAENTMDADKGSVTGTNNGAVFDSTTYKVGSYSIERDGNNDNVVFAISTSHLEKEGGQIGFWWYNGNGYQAASLNRILTIVDTGGDDSIVLKVHSSGGLSLYWDSQAASSDAAEYTAAALSTSTWYYIVLFWHQGDAGNDLILTIYDEAGSVAGSATDANITAFTDDPSTLTIFTATSDAHRSNVDNFIISNDETRDMLAVRDVTNFN